jgi:hypothetical protein
MAALVRPAALQRATAGFLLDAVSRVVDLNSASPNSVKR